MGFNFLVLINLAIVNAIGSSKLDLNSYLRDPLPDNCSDFVKEHIIKYFDDVQVTEISPVIKYGQDALPYVCLMSLDVAAELCKIPDLQTKLIQPRKLKPVCPMDYVLKPSNLKINITKGVEYMSNETSCNVVCYFIQNLSHICQFITLANDIIMEGKSVGESVDHVKGGDQSVVLHKKNGTNSLAGTGMISQGTKLTQTKPKVSPEQLRKKIVQGLTEKKPDINKPVTKTEGVTVNGKTITASVDLKPNLESGRPDGSSSDIYDNYKVLNTANSFNASVNKTVLKNSSFKHNENDKVKHSEINKLENLPSDNGNKDILGTESQLPLENDYSSKTQQTNFKNNNNKNNNNNIEFEDDPALKTPHDDGEDDDDENNNEDIDKSAIMQDALLDGERQFAKSVNHKEIYSGDNFFQAEDSHFSMYFLTTVSIIIIGYVIYHNKKKILAYALEGRRNKNGRRRPTSASYRKLDCNLEEAIASNPSNTSVTNVVY